MSSPSHATAGKEKPEGPKCYGWRRVDGEGLDGWMDGWGRTDGEGWMEKDGWMGKDGWINERMDK